MRHIQDRTEEIPTIDDAIQELLNNYKKKSEKKFLISRIGLFIGSVALKNL